MRRESVRVTKEDDEQLPAALEGRDESVLAVSDMSLLSNRYGQS